MPIALLIIILYKISLPVSDHPDSQVLEEVSFTRNKSIKTCRVIMTPCCQFNVSTRIREEAVLNNLIWNISGVDCSPVTLALNNYFDLNKKKGVTSKVITVK